MTKSIKHLATLLRIVPALAPLALPLSASPVTAQSAGQPKISPQLLTEMIADPLERIPVIIEMNAATPPFSSGGNQSLALQAVSILNANGQAFGGLSIIEGAAGVATSAGINAMSLLPQVAAIEQDAVVRPRRPAGSSPTNPPGALTSLYPQEVQYNSPLAWKSLTYLGTNWSGYTWLRLPWIDPTWGNIAWDNIAWDSAGWNNIAWDSFKYD